MLARYIHGPMQGVDDPIAEYSGSGVAPADRINLYSDARGSIVLRAGATGSTPTINTYDEYGQPSASNQGAFQYTGQVYLPEIGMFYYKARIYSPALGRFMQTDPIGYEDNVNLYAYVGNDPINGTDFTGLEEDDDNDVEIVGELEDIVTGVFEGSFSPLDLGGSWTEIIEGVQEASAEGKGAVTLFGGVATVSVECYSNLSEGGSVSLVYSVGAHSISIEGAVNDEGDWAGRIDYAGWAVNASATLANLNFDGDVTPGYLTREFTRNLRNRERLREHVGDRFDELNRLMRDHLGIDE